MNFRSVTGIQFRKARMLVFGLLGVRERVGWRLQTDSAARNGASGRESTLIARDLKKSYGEFRAVKGVDFEVYRGECFGFLGPNGAGKTTTMRMIYGGSIPTAGELTVAGLDVKREERRVKRRIGVVPQENNLDDDLKVKENLLVYGRYFDLPKKTVLPRAEELLDFVQLTEKANSKVEHLSGGMKRRLLIARALINDPEIVVLDEPTTGLDPQARHLVWDRLRELTRENKTLDAHHALYGRGGAALRPVGNNGGWGDHRLRLAADHDRGAREPAGS